VAIGLAGGPELLFLDEPTTGFDPAARRGAWKMIRDLKATGATVLLTTHYLDEAEALADRVAFIFEGRITAEGTPAELRGAYRETSISFAWDGATELPFAAKSEDGRAVIHTSEPTRVLHELTAWATSRGVELEDLRVAPASLEDVYLRLSEAGE
jgi:ABC-2 type transport system ATP-binding protein